MTNGRSKKYLLSALVLVLILAAAAGILLYISKNTTYSQKELLQLAEDIVAKQNSDVYHVSDAYLHPFEESKLMVGVDDLDDAKIEAFKKDWPKLHYKYIEFRDTKDLVRVIGTQG